MSTRQLVRVFNSKAPNTITEEIQIKDVFLCPIRNDLVGTVFRDLNKNRRQPYGVDQLAGMRHSAESYHTGRALARIPRINGSGTHASGSGAFGNMCRGGRRFNPTTIWRRWHRKVNITQRRHAVASALAASAVPSLVLARGHKINNIPEIPLVVDSLQVSKTKELIKILETLGCGEELQRVIDGKKVRVGNGKQRNRRYKLKKGPLIIYDNGSINVVKAARNIPGVEVCNIDRLNLLQLCPGGHIGRLLIWTKDAFNKLDYIFGTKTTPGTGKKGYVLERPILSNSNIARIINSSDIQEECRPKLNNTPLHDRQKKNPLTNKTMMNFLNPYSKVRRTENKKKQEEAIKNKESNRKAKLAEKKKFRKNGRKFISTYYKELEQANERTIRQYKQYIKSTKIGKAALPAEDEIGEESSQN